MLRFSLIFLIALLGVSAFAQTDGEMRRHLVNEEGYRLYPYLVRGVPHIGIGHRLFGPSRPITPAEVESLFARDLAVARRAAHAAVKTFDRQPHDVRVILIGIAYSTGHRGFTRFVEMRAALDRFDYWRAADALRKSLWANQLPSRASRYIGVLESAGTRRLKDDLQIRLDIRPEPVQPFHVQR